MASACLAPSARRSRAESHGSFSQTTPPFPPAPEICHISPAATPGVRICSGESPRLMGVSAGIQFAHQELRMGASSPFPHGPTAHLPSVPTSCCTTRKQESVCGGLAVCLGKHESHFKVTH